MPSLTHSKRAPSGRLPDELRSPRSSSATDLASPRGIVLASACAAGDEAAWEHFVLTERPVLYRAADTLNPSGGARDLADSLYADLFGLPAGAGERKSLFRYFHGRSSLSDVAAGGAGAETRGPHAGESACGAAARRGVGLCPSSAQRADRTRAGSLSEADAGGHQACHGGLAGARSASTGLLLCARAHARADRKSPRRARGHRVAGACPRAGDIRKEVEQDLERAGLRLPR